MYMMILEESSSVCMQALYLVVPLTSMVSLHGMHIPCVVYHMEDVYMYTITITITSIALHVSVEYYY